MTLKKKNCPNIIKIIPIVYYYYYYLVSIWSRWLKYEINSLIYTLSFLVIYFSNCNFYKCYPNTQLFQKAFFNSFYQILSFWKNTFSLCTFWKLNFFKKSNLKKLNQLKRTKGIVHELVGSLKGTSVLRGAAIWS